jgi:shikimate kinase
MIKPKRIFIIGHTGARKSLVGEALAERLGWKYIDANPGLERYIGRNLNEILGEQGEESFHECESEIISHYKAQQHVVVILEEVVIATEKNRKLLSSEFVIYLKVSTKLQMERWSSGRTPLLPIANLKTYLDKQHLERDSLFEEIATLSLESSAIEQDVIKIVEALEE